MLQMFQIMFHVRPDVLNKPDAGIINMTNNSWNDVEFLSNFCKLFHHPIPTNYKQLQVLFK